MLVCMFTSDSKIDGSYASKAQPCLASYARQLAVRACVVSPRSKRDQKSVVLRLVSPLAVMESLGRRGSTYINTHIKKGPGRIKSIFRRLRAYLVSIILKHYSDPLNQVQVLVVTRRYLLWRVAYQESRKLWYTGDQSLYQDPTHNRRTPP
jgi:hypothetical protein